MRKGNTAGYNLFTWVIDAHPEDIGQVDFKRPNGEPVMRTMADYRQLNDALFHAGLNSGSEYEWEDTPNRLHFYVIDRHQDARGVLSYKVGVRSLDGAGSQTRAVALKAATSCRFTLTNTGQAPDIYRLSAEGGSARLGNALAGLNPGESQPVEVIAAGASTLRAQSESDSTKTATASCSGPR